MSLESFYGGKQGISPVIRGSFQYIDTEDDAYKAAIAAGATAADLASLTMDVMLADSNYEDVWYNELCIIDTKNKANKNNGKLFRRTLKGRGDTGVEKCAEYIGQIVGPAGANPFMAFTSLDGVKDKANGNYTINDDTVINWPDREDSTSSVKPKDGINPYIFDGDINNKMIVPGKDKNNNYNDTIRYTWFNMVDNMTEDATQSMVYLGFQIPYPSIDITTTAIDWDEEVSSIKRTGEGYDEHPFYHSWNIEIPRGVRGNAASNIRLAQYKDFSNLSGDTLKPFLYDFENGVVEANSKRGVFTIKEVTPAIFENQTPEELAAHQNVPFWVYDYIFYDKQPGDISKDRIKTYTFYLGSYKEISNITFDDDGTVTFIYSDTSKDTFTQKVQWVKNIEISTTGLITFTYNTKDNNSFKTYTKRLPFPDKLVISEEGEITTSFKDGTSLQLVTSWGNEDPFDLNYVKTLSMDDDTKVLSYTTYPKNKGEVLNNGEGINYIQAMTIDEKYHLLVYYASSQFRPTQEEVAKGEKNGDVFVINDEANVNYVTWKGQTFRDGIIYDGIPQGDYWQDFGLMRQVQKGIRVWATFNLESHPYYNALESYTHQQFIDSVLNVQYWDNAKEILNPYYGGKIGNEIDENGDPLTGAFCYTTKIESGSAYYYDYDAHSWAYAGSWGASDTTDVSINTVRLDNKTLSDTGITFIERESHSNSSTLPILYW